MNILFLSLHLLFPYRASRCFFAVSVHAHIAISHSNAGGGGGSSRGGVALGQAVASTGAGAWQLTYFSSTSASKWQWDGCSQQPSHQTVWICENTDLKSLVEKYELGEKYFSVLTKSFRCEDILQL